MHVVKYTESERGWSSEVWFRGFDSVEEAQEAVRQCNKDLPHGYVPDYYIIAEYLGERAELPEDYKR